MTKDLDEVGNETEKREIFFYRHQVHAFIVQAFPRTHANPYDTTRRQIEV